MYTEIFWDLAIWQQIRIDSAAQTSQIMGLIRVGERTHACAIRNILPWLLIDLITSSNERSADSNEIICPSTTVICTILVQQYYIVQGGISLKGFHECGCVRNWRKNSVFSWKFPGIKVNYVSPTTQLMVVRSTVPVCPLKFFLFLLLGVDEA